MRRRTEQLVFDEERTTEWFRKGRLHRKEGKGLLQRHCRHGFQLVEHCNIGHLQICARCFRTLFIGVL